jgi:hypothetical protein
MTCGHTSKMHKDGETQFHLRVEPRRTVLVQNTDCFAQQRLRIPDGT